MLAIGNHQMKCQNNHNMTFVITILFSPNTERVGGQNRSKSPKMYFLYTYYTVYVYSRYRNKMNDLMLDNGISNAFPDLSEWNINRCSVCFPTHPIQPSNPAHQEAFPPPAERLHQPHGPRRPGPLGVHPGLRASAAQPQRL